MTYNKAIAAIATLTAIAMAPAAMAQDRHEAAHMGPAASVSFADINLASENGVNLLDRRIRSAARRVCGTPESNALFGGPVRLCIRETIAAVQNTRDTIVASARSEDGSRLAFTSFEIRRAM